MKHPQSIQTLINQLVQKEIQILSKAPKEGLSLVEHETIQD